MANYPVNKIRNVCLMGHGGDGKTSLVESLLNIAGVTDRVGKIADGNTVCDFDPEEIKRKFSISTAVAPVEWNGCKINLLDTPGFFDFESEVQCALRVAESALIVATGKSGPGVGTEKAWAHCESTQCRVCSTSPRSTRETRITITLCTSCRSSSAYR
ncbi:MAG: GTP-binding protein [Butyricicoccus sp.]